MSGQSVLGNHEIYFRGLAGICRENLIRFRNYLMLITNGFGDWIRQLPLILPMRDGILVHAGIPTGHSQSEVFDGVSWSKG